VSAAMNYC